LDFDSSAFDRTLQHLSSYRINGTQMISTRVVYLKLPVECIPSVEPLPVRVHPPKLTGASNARKRRNKASFTRTYPRFRSPQARHSLDTRVGQERVVANA
jgi:hypothetical protein